MNVAESRVKFVDACENEDFQGFLDLINLHCQKNESFDIGELLATIDKHQLDDIWANLQRKATTALLSLENDEDDNTNNLELGGELLEGIVIVASSTIQLDNIIIPEAMYETIVLLHGILLSIPEELPKLRNNISLLCEAWWSGNLNGRDDLASQTIIFLLERSLQPKSAKVDIKRVWKMHDCLQNIDFSDGSSERLKVLMQNAAVWPPFLKSPEGKKFISYCLCLNAEVLDLIHVTIKYTLHAVSRSTCEAYGEIYFKAWRNSSDKTLQKFESSCIQDLMFLAVNVESKVVGANIRQILGYFHKQKLQSNVDAMLKRLYEPIIWRSFKVANDSVRASALSLLIDAFPLQDPGANIEATDTLRQKQFDILSEALYDTSAIVRAIACQGVCKICNLYWEMLPPAVVKDYISKLASDMVWDAASSDVRCSVIKGFSHLLDNHLSHPLMKAVLPQLKHVLHDSSEKVRVLFIDLLIKVKGIRAIKFWHVTPVEHLLARLELDSACIVKRVTSLLLNSYMPLERDSGEQLRRCVTLIQDNPTAARRFYQSVAKNHLSFAQTSKLMTVLCRCLLQVVRSARRRHDAAAPSSSSGDSAFVSGDILESFSEENDVNHSDSGLDIASGDTTRSSRQDADNDDEDDAEVDDELSMDDTEVILGLLDVIIVMWNVIAPALEKAENIEIRQRLEQRFKVAMTEFLRAFHDPRIVTSLIVLASFLPASAVPLLSRSLLSKLRGFTASQSTENDYASMLRCMCRWSKCDDVMELIADWLKPALTLKDYSNAADDNNTSKRRVSSRRRTVQFREPCDPQPMLALDYLGYMLRAHECRSHVLQTTEIDAIAAVLDNSKACLLRRLGGEQMSNAHCTDKFLQQAFETVLKLKVLRHDSTNAERDASIMFRHLLRWTEKNLLSLLRHGDATSAGHRKGRRLLTSQDVTLLSDAPRRSGVLDATSLENVTLSTTLLSETVAMKRTMGDSQLEEAHHLAHALLQSVLSVGTEVVLVGVADAELAVCLADFAVQLLKLDECSKLLVAVTKLMYQLTELLQSGTGADDVISNRQSHVIPDMLQRLVERLVVMVKTNREQTTRILPSIKSTVSETLLAYFKYLSLTQTVDSDVMSAIVTATVQELEDNIRKDPTLEACRSVAELPPLTAFLLAVLQRKSDVIRLYLRLLFESLQEEVTSADSYLPAVCVHIVSSLSSDARLRADVKQGVNVLLLQLEKHQSPADVPDEARPCGDIVQRSREQVAQLQDKLGMVA